MLECFSVYYSTLKLLTLIFLCITFYLYRISNTLRILCITVVIIIICYLRLSHLI